jgi:hypothetical protein
MMLTLTIAVEVRGVLVLGLGSMALLQVIFTSSVVLPFYLTVQTQRRD